MFRMNYIKFATKSTYMNHIMYLDQTSLAKGGIIRNPSKSKLPLRNRANSLNTIVILIKITVSCFAQQIKLLVSANILKEINQIAWRKLRKI